MLPTTSTPLTMTSLELVDFINEDRKARAQAVGAGFPSLGFAKLEHADFLKKVLQVLGQELAGKFSCKFVVATGNGGERTSPGYCFPKREACLMAMSYSYELQAKVFDRMTALEQSRTQMPALPNFADPVAAARAWADAKEGEQRASQALALAAPKAEFVDLYVDTRDTKGFRDVCKLLGAQEGEFRDFLLARRIAYYLNRVLAPYADHMHAGRMSVKVAMAGDKSTTQMRFTPKGVNWIAGLWGQHQAENRLRLEHRG